MSCQGSGAKASKDPVQTEDVTVCVTEIADANTITKRLRTLQIKQFHRVNLLPLVVVTYMFTFPFVFVFFEYVAFRNGCDRLVDSVVKCFSRLLCAVCLL